MEIILTAHICILMGFVKLSRLQMDLILHHSMILEEAPMSKGDLDKYIIMISSHISPLDPPNSQENADETSKINAYL